MPHFHKPLARPLPLPTHPPRTTCNTHTQSPLRVVLARFGWARRGRPWRNGLDGAGPKEDLMATWEEKPARRDPHALYHAGTILRTHHHTLIHPHKH